MELALNKRAAIVNHFARRVSAESILSDRETVGYIVTEFGFIIIMPSSVRGIRSEGDHEFGSGCYAQFKDLYSLGMLKLREQKVP